MNTQLPQTVSRISLERPASIRRQIPAFNDVGWMISDYVVGKENAGLNYLFDEETLDRLASLSPIVFYGEKTTGKTALSITLSVCWSRYTGNRPLCFTTGAAFASDYAAAVEIDDIDSFRTRHRQCKLLVIDDLEPISAKPAAQAELSHTLDSLAASGAPVIASAGKLPASLTGIDPSLASRFSGGYSIALKRPEAAARSAIIESLCEKANKNLPALRIAEFCSDLGLPLKATDLTTIVTVAKQNCTPEGLLDFEVLRQLVTQFMAGDALSVQKIAKAVARKMRVKLTDMRGSTRQANIVRARGLAILLARKMTPDSLQQIGQFFGGRDHSTVLHACRKTSKLIESDSELSKAVADLQAELLS